MSKQINNQCQNWKTWYDGDATNKFINCWLEPLLNVLESYVFRLNLDLWLNRDFKVVLTHDCKIRENLDPEKNLVRLTGDYIDRGDSSSEIVCHIKNIHDKIDKEAQKNGNYELKKCFVTTIGNHEVNFLPDNGSAWYASALCKKMISQSYLVSGDIIQSKDNDNNDCMFSFSHTVVFNGSYPLILKQILELSELAENINSQDISNLNNQIVVWIKSNFPGNNNDISAVGLEILKRIVERYKKVVSDNKYKDVFQKFCDNRKLIDSTLNEHMRDFSLDTLLGIQWRIFEKGNKVYEELRDKLNEQDYFLLKYLAMDVFCYPVVSDFDDKKKILSNIANLNDLKQLDFDSEREVSIFNLTFSEIRASKRFFPTCFLSVTNILSCNALDIHGRTVNNFTWEVSTCEDVFDMQNLINCDNKDASQIQCELDNVDKRAFEKQWPINIIQVHGHDRRLSHTYFSHPGGVNGDITGSIGYNGADNHKERPDYKCTFIGTAHINLNDHNKSQTEILEYNHSTNKVKVLNNDKEQQTKELPLFTSPNNDYFNNVPDSDSAVQKLGSPGKSNLNNQNEINNMNNNLNNMSYGMNNNFNQNTNFYNINNYGMNINNGNNMNDNNFNQNLNNINNLNNNNYGMNNNFNQNLNNINNLNNNSINNNNVDNDNNIKIIIKCGSNSGVSDVRELPIPINVNLTQDGEKSFKDILGSLEEKLKQENLSLDVIKLVRDTQVLDLQEPVKNLNFKNNDNICVYIKPEKMFTLTLNFELDYTENNDISNINIKNENNEDDKESPKCIGGCFYKHVKLRELIENLIEKYRLKKDIFWEQIKKSNLFIGDKCVKDGDLDKTVSEFLGWNINDNQKSVEVNAVMKGISLNDIKIVEFKFEIPKLSTFYVKFCPSETLKAVVARWCQENKFKTDEFIELINLGKIELTSENKKLESKDLDCQIKNIDGININLSKNVLVLKMQVGEDTNLDDIKDKSFDIFFKVENPSKEFWIKNLNETQTLKQIIKEVANLVGKNTDSEKKYFDDIVAQIEQSKLKIVGKDNVNKGNEEEKNNEKDNNEYIFKKDDLDKPFYKIVGDIKKYAVGQNKNGLDIRLQIPTLKINQKNINGSDILINSDINNNINNDSIDVSRPNDNVLQVKKKIYNPNSHREKSNWLFKVLRWLAIIFAVLLFLAFMLKFALVLKIIFVCIDVICCLILIALKLKSYYQRKHRNYENLSTSTDYYRQQRVVNDINNETQNDLHEDPNKKKYNNIDDNFQV